MERKSDIMQVLAGMLCLLGAFFFMAGSVGVIRFPDSLSRIHALTKADNLGLGFIVLALVITSQSVAVGLKLILIWVLALVASSSICFFLGRKLIRGG